MRPHRNWVVGSSIVCALFGLAGYWAGQRWPSVSSPPATVESTVPPSLQVPTLHSTEEPSEGTKEDRKLTHAAHGRTRDRSEWQGMSTEGTLHAMCTTSRECGLAAACIDQRCVACANDEECGKGEVCVLEHCLRSNRVRCRSRSDCAAQDVCALSGYSDDPRGNAKLDAYCLADTGGKQAAQSWPQDWTPGPADAPQVQATELLDSLREPAKQ